MVQLPTPGWQRVWLPLELKKHPVDAFLGFAQSLPSVHTLCDIGFIYDLGFAYARSIWEECRSVKKQTDSLVAHACHIITISQATGADLHAEYGLASENITVAYPGVDASFSPAGEKYIGPDPYFLFDGSLNRAKDIPRLIEAFGEFVTLQKAKRLDSRLRGNDTLFDLYLIGGDYWPDGAIDALIHKLHLKDRVKKMGFVHEDALLSYYRGAVALTTTALREGFCLPVAEAMACGTPVVALDRGALKEVVGEGGILVSLKSKDESRTSGFADAMERMMDRRAREVFAKKAIIQVRKFTWEKFGRQILKKISIFSRPPLANAKGVAFKTNEYKAF